MLVVHLLPLRVLLSAKWPCLYLLPITFFLNFFTRDVCLVITNIYTEVSWECDCSSLCLAFICCMYVVAVSRASWYSRFLAVRVNLFRF